jgi:hypothetical protein
MRRLRNGKSCRKYPTMSAPKKRWCPERRRVRSSSRSQASVHALTNGAPADFSEPFCSSGFFSSSIKWLGFTECPKIGFPGDTDLSGDRTRLPSRRLFQPLNGHILSPALRNLQSSCRAQLAIPLLAQKNLCPLSSLLRRLAIKGCFSHQRSAFR